MKKFCNICNQIISEEEYNYSIKRFSKALCREHQLKTLKKDFYIKPEPTPQALKLGNLLKSMGHKVEFEKYDGYKHIDIAIVKSKVNIEVDGGQHHGKTQALRDLKRTFYSWNKDYVTLRIPNCLTKEEDTLKEAAELIHRFLDKGRTQQLEKEIRAEYEEEDNPIWKDVSNFINNTSEVIKKASDKLNKLLRKFN
jgi:very-short-patch-repair endonuclease